MPTDIFVSRPGFRDLQVIYVDQGVGGTPAQQHWAEKIVAVNADGSPITAGASANVAKATAAAPVYGEGTNVQLSVDLAGNLRTGGGGGGGLTDAQLRATPVPVDVNDRAARLVGVVYGSQGQQVKQTAVNFNLANEIHVGATAIDPRSIRALTSSDVVDVSDRAGRALGVVASITAAVAVTNANLDATISSRLKPADTLTAVTTVTSLTQMNGQAIQMGTGVRTAGTQRVTIATDDVVAVTGTFFQATQPVSIAAAVDVSDRAARLVGRVYGSQGQQLLQTAVNFNQQVEVAVGATLIDPRSIRALTIADVVDLGDRAAREAGRVRIWDGTDEATVLPVRTQPATTEKLLMVADLPIRLATYQTTTITVAPAITIGVKELLALWYTGGTKDIYIVEIWVSGLVTTASTTGGRTTVRVSTITSAPTGGTEEAKVDVAGGGASAITNTMRVKTGGGAIGSTFIRREVWHATQAIGSTYDKSIFTASSVGNGIILRGGSSAGISIDVEREVAHTALVDSWTVGVRWLEL